RKERGPVAHASLDDRRKLLDGLGDRSLGAVGSAADEDDPGVSRDVLVRAVYGRDLDLDAAPARPLGERRDVADVAITVELGWKQVRDLRPRAANTRSGAHTGIGSRTPCDTRPARRRRSPV